MGRAQLNAEAAVERLSVDDVMARTLTASEHTHRYRWAARLVAGLRVLDLCCGVGYGTAILASTAREVSGIDLSESAIEDARREYGDAAGFETGDAMELLAREDLVDRFDAIVCFEGLEHLPDLRAAVGHLARHAANGLRVVASLPNSGTFGEENEFHVTAPDLEVALDAFRQLPQAVVALQFNAEGSLIVPADDGELGDAEVSLLDRVEPEYANNFLVAANVPVEQAVDGLARLTLTPYYNRQLRTLGQANQELWEANRRLGRQVRALSAQEDVRARGWEALRQGQTSAARTLIKMEGRLEAEREQIRRLEGEAAVGWGRYHELRNRRMIKLVLGLSRLLKR